MKNGVIIILMLVLSGCSFGGFLYHNLHYVVSWKVDDYVDLDASQEKLLRQASEDFVTWHKENELIQYKTLLKELAIDLKNQTLTEESAQVYHLKMLQLVNNIGEYLKPRLPALLATLSTEQYQEINKNISERIEKRQQRSPEERFERRIDRAEEWFGDLTDEQELMVKHWGEQRKSYEQNMAKKREVWLLELDKNSVDDNHRPELYNDTLWSMFDYWASTQSQQPSMNSMLWFESDEKQQKHLLSVLEKLQSKIDSILDAS